VQRGLRNGVCWHSISKFAQNLKLFTTATKHATAARPSPGALIRRRGGQA